jgi:hypothetical protein
MLFTALLDALQVTSNLSVVNSSPGKVKVNPLYYPQNLYDKSIVASESDVTVAL